MAPNKLTKSALEIEGPLFWIVPCLRPSAKKLLRDRKSHSSFICCELDSRISCARGRGVRLCAVAAHVGLCAALHGVAACSRAIQHAGLPFAVRDHRSVD